MVLGILGLDTDRVDEATSFRLLDEYVDGGGVWIDTANCYSYWSDPSGHGGQSEAFLGRWLKSRPGIRERVKISTKVGCEPISSGDEEFATEGLARDVITAGIRDSFERLGTDYVDLYWAHRDDHEVAQEETVTTFGELVEDGLALRWGYSNAALWRVERARSIAATNNVVPPTALQLRYSYLQPRPMVRDHDHDHRFGWITDEVLDYAEHNPEIELWAYSPLLSGAYDRSDRAISDAFAHPGTTRRLAALRDVADRLGLSRSEVVTAWLSGGEPSVVPIVGISNHDQLTSALRGSRTVLSEAARRQLDTPW